MQWFRSKSKGGRAPSEVMDDFENVSHSDAVGSIGRNVASAGTYNQAPVQVVVTTPTSGDMPSAYRAPQSLSRPSPSLLSDASFPSPNAGLPSRGINTIPNLSDTAARGGFNKSALRVHRGAVDHDMITVRSPPEIMARVTKVLLELGIEVQQESEFKYRSIRHKRKKYGGSTANGLTAFTMVGSAASNGVCRGFFLIYALTYNDTISGRQERPPHSVVFRHRRHAERFVDATPVFANFCFWCSLSRLI